MKNEDMQKLTNTIQEKLGEENASLIADDLGILLTDTANTNKQIEEKDNLIDKLKKDKDNLISTNGKLLQQVAMGFEETPKNNDEEGNKKSISYKDVFDENGNFIK